MSLRIRLNITSSTALVSTYFPIQGGNSRYHHVFTMLMQHSPLQSLSTTAHLPLQDPSHVLLVFPNLSK